MTKEEILKFISENQGEQLLDFYDKTYEKLKDLNRRIDKISLFLIVLVFLYFIASSATISSFSIGPIAISDISLISQLIPILFAWQLLDLAITSGHKSELHTTVKFLFLSIYKQDVNPKDLETGGFNVFTRIILPFSYTHELSKFSKEKKINIAIGCLGGLLVIPLLLLIFLPFYFEYYMLKEVYFKYYSTTFGKLSFYSSLWIIAMVFYYYINTTFLALKNYKAGRV